MIRFFVYLVFFGIFSLIISRFLDVSFGKWKICIKVKDEVLSGIQNEKEKTKEKEMKKETKIQNYITPRYYDEQLESSRSADSVERKEGFVENGGEVKVRQKPVADFKEYQKTKNAPDEEKKDYDPIKEIIEKKTSR
ncbi:hypothetical protein HRbin19_00212 [bacterium HR19]|nr:hypothetical protein HRbin19_00212 [bacterium HR19]